MSITDELREWFKDHMFKENGWQEVYAIADRIDAEHERAMADAYLSGTPTDEKLTELGCIRLPKDADGEYIHIGDEMETERFGVVEVEGFIHNAIAFNVYDPQPARICTVPANQCRHYHVLTVEDVLREFTDAILEWAVKSGTIVEVGTWSDVAAEYAAKLQLKEN